MNGPSMLPNNNTDGGNWHDRYHRIFLFIALPIGLLYVFLSPAFQVPDEHTHFFRIYHLSEGGLIAQKVGDITGAPLPRSLPTTTFIYTRGIFEKNDGIISPEIISATLGIPLMPGDTAFVAFSNTALYSPVPYIPQVIGVGVGRLANAPPLVLLYLGRLFNFLAALVLLTLAVRTMPFFKPVLILVLLTPTTMYQLASLSADALTIGFSVLFIAMALRAAYGDGQVEPAKLFASFLVLSIAVCLSKSAYFLLPLLVFVVPSAKFGSRGMLKKALVVLVGIAAMGLWGLLVKDIYSPSYAFKQIDAEGVKNFILESPWRYTLILAYSIATDGWSYLMNFVGIQDWDLRVLPDWFSALYIVWLVIAAAVPLCAKFRVPQWHKLYIAAIGWVSLIVILTVVYISWSPPGFHYIVGMQGRYLVPILPLILLPLYNVIRFPDGVSSFARTGTPALAASALLTALIINYFKFYVG